MLLHLAWASVTLKHKSSKQAGRGRRPPPKGRRRLLQAPRHRSAPHTRWPLPDSPVASRWGEQAPPELVLGKRVHQQREKRGAGEGLQGALRSAQLFCEPGPA